MKKAQDGRRATSQCGRLSNSTAPRAYGALCAEIGEQPADVALAWVLYNGVLAATHRLRTRHPGNVIGQAATHKNCPQNP
ncbi:hypothetical protein [Streptomyces sp. NPDC048361]|uniref:hypothetical protein n=1 Tax=Streptomyces sp. NPDC048361 TaxID=3154720 RepID=UPI00343273E5